MTSKRGHRGDADIAVMVVPSPDVAKSRLRARRAVANA